MGENEERTGGLFEYRGRVLKRIRDRETENVLETKWGKGDTEREQGGKSRTKDQKSVRTKKKTWLIRGRFVCMEPRGKEQSQNQEVRQTCRKNYRGNQWSLSFD